jgi:hypothetical protein
LHSRTQIAGGTRAVIGSFSGCVADTGSGTDLRATLCMSNEELTAFVAVFCGIALFTTVLTVVAVRSRRAGDAESLALRASEVVTQTKDLLVGPGFLWAVWHDTAKVAEMKMLIRNHRDEVLSTVVVPTVVLDGVLKRFDLDGRQYEIRERGLMSNRTHLCEAGQDEVLLSAEHETFRTTFFLGDGTKALFSVPAASALKRFASIEAGGREIGKLIVGLRQDTATRILTLPDGRSSLLEQVFVLAS